MIYKGSKGKDLDLFGCSAGDKQPSTTNVPPMHATTHMSHTYRPI